MSVCMRVKQQTDNLFIINSNYIHSVVINCGWNNNVAVKYSSFLLKLKCIYTFIVTR